MMSVVGLGKPTTSNERRLTKSENTMTKKNEVALTDAQMSLPSFAVAPEGTKTAADTVASDDLAVPQLKLLQPGSPEVTSIAGATPGAFFNTVSQETVSEVMCVNISSTTTYGIFNKAARTLVAIFDTLSEADTALAALPGSPSMYDLSESKVHSCYALKEDGTLDYPFRLYFKSTGIRIAQNWNTDIINRYGQQAPRHAGVYKLTREMRKNDKGTWYLPKPEFQGYVQSAEVFAQLNEIATSFDK